MFDVLVGNQSAKAVKQSMLSCCQGHQAFKAVKQSITSIVHICTCFYLFEAVIDIQRPVVFPTKGYNLRLE